MKLEAQLEKMDHLLGELLEKADPAKKETIDILRVIVKKELGLVQADVPNLDTEIVIAEVSQVIDQLVINS